MADETNATNPESNAVAGEKTAKKSTRKRKTTAKKATTKKKTTRTKRTAKASAQAADAGEKASATEATKPASVTPKKKTRRTSKRAKRTTADSNPPQTDASSAEPAEAVLPAPATQTSEQQGDGAAASAREAAKAESKPVAMKTRRKRAKRRTAKDQKESQAPETQPAAPPSEPSPDAPAQAGAATRGPSTTEHRSVPPQPPRTDNRDVRPAPAGRTTEQPKALPAPDTRSALPDRKQPFGFGIAPGGAPTSEPPVRASESAATAQGSATPPAKDAADRPPAEGADAPSAGPQAEEPPKGKRKRRRKSHAQRRREQAERQKNAATDEAKPAADHDASAGDTDADLAKTSPDTQSASDAAADSPEEDAPRIVLKQRPPRRARGKRRRGKKTPDQAGGEAAARSGDEPAPAAKGDLAAPAATPPPPAAPADTEADESLDDDMAPTEIGMNRIEVIDDSHPAPKTLKDGREMIINVTAGAECRIAILENQRLEELNIERQSLASHVGNIYMGRITNVEPSIQAAFVDFGLAKNGFLHISDVLPKYFPNSKNELEQVGKKVPRRDRPPIQKCFRRGDKVIVQVVKEGVGTKGPTLTTYLSIPGRFMVMMPGMDRLGVSRKIEDENDRRAMRDILNQLNLPGGMGFILRTAGLNRNKRELQSDLNYLSRLWKTVEQRIQRSNSPCELYQESDLVIRTIRDVYSSDFKRIVVDDADTARKASEFLRIAMPRTPNLVIEYRRSEPVFHCFGIEQEIERIHSRHVPLPSGGSIVIDSTEAMVAIDVNSGKFRELQDAEETAYRINLEAAEEIARHLRLRDLGGLVVCDFIDMRMDRHKRAVEKALRDALKKHKERARILRMSKFGLIEMTRQRQRQSLKRSIFVDCPHCRGSGLVKTPESMSLEVIRVLQILVNRQEVARITVSAAPPVAALILNDHRAYLYRLEDKSGKRISITPNSAFTRDQVEYECSDDRGMPLRIDL